MSQSGPTASVASSCTQSNGSAQASASVQNGILRMNANTALAANSYGGTGATAQAYWQDILDISATGVSYVEFFFAVQGTNIRSAGNQSSGSGYWYSDANASLRVASGSYYDVIRTYELSPANGYALYYHPSSVSHFDLFSYRSPVSNGSAYIAYQLQSYSIVNSVQWSSSSGAATNPAMQSTSSFGNSAGITGVRFLNASQQTVSNVSYSFRNGTAFYDPYASSTVPEPSTWAMLGAGLLMLVAVRRRRQETTQR